MVRGPLKSLSFAPRSQNRVLGLEMWAEGGRQPSSLYILGIHGPHTDRLGWHDFCADIVDVVGSRFKKGPLAVAGDWNVDYAPTFEHYPLQPSLDTHMEERREMLDQICELHDFEISFPEVVDGLPANPLHHDACLNFPFTRTPVGLQHGRPSLLDFVLSTRGSASGCWGSWKGLPSDHAMIAVSIAWKSHVKVHPRSTWVMRDREGAVCFLRDQWSEVFTASPRYDLSDATPRAFFNMLARVRDTFADPSTCAARRKSRFPFSLRSLCYRYEHCSAHDKPYYLSLLWKAKVRWYESLRVQRQNAQIDRGRAVSKSKRLHSISSISNSSGERFSDDNTIVQTLANHFSEKFGCRNLHLREAILDFARASEGDLPGFDEMDVDRALARCRKPFRLDGYGMCLELFRIAFEARPNDFVSWLQFVVSNETMMSSLESPLLCYGKQSKHSKLAHVRGIIPPCTLLKVLDCLLASLLTDRLSVLLPKHPDVFVGARKFTQPKDLGQGLNLVIEKGLDLKSNAAIAQADIATYFDKLPVFRIVMWLLLHGVERSLLAAIIRHQLCTILRLRRGAVSLVVARRSSGGLTGSNIALALSRIPVESAFLELLPACRLKGFLAGSTRLVFGSWVDNIYTAAHSVEDAVELIAKVFQHLRLTWNLDMKDQSGCVLPCRGAVLENYSDMSGIRVTSDFEVLGWHLTDNGSMAVNWRALQASAWSAFWLNVRARSWKQFGLKRRFALLQRCVRPLIMYKLQIFAPTKFWVAQVDKLQKHMLSRTLGWHRLASEDPKVYWKRVSVGVQEHLGTSVSVWSTDWLKSTISWDQHAVRDFTEQERFVQRHPNYFDNIQVSCFSNSASFGAVDHFSTSFSWAVKLTRHMNAEFFSARRVTESRGGLFGALHTRTSTRTVTGSVVQRYHDSVVFARECLHSRGEREPR